MVGRVEEAEHGGGRQTAADLWTFSAPPLVVQQELHRKHSMIGSGARITAKQHMLPVMTFNLLLSEKLSE